MNGGRVDEVAEILLAGCGSDIHSRVLLPVCVMNYSAVHHVTQQHLAEVAVLQAAPERVVAAAIRFPDGQVFANSCHDLAIEDANTAGRIVGLGASAEPYETWEPFESGFVTSHNRFVGREEAYNLALAGGGKQDRKHRHGVIGAAIHAAQHAIGKAHGH